MEQVARVSYLVQLVKNPSKREGATVYLKGGKCNLIDINPVIAEGRENSLTEEASSI